MDTKATITSNDIITWYMNHVLEHNENPKSVFAFAKANDFDEAEFYNHFASFESLEKGIFTAFFENTHAVIIKSDSYNGFNARNKLLTFYYTFFENLTANRSYVVYALGKDKNKLKTLKTLEALKKPFSTYIESLEIETLDLKQERLEKLQQKGIKETAWTQLLVMIKFWLDDTSIAFEKTDIFIEKSINTGFDIIDTAPLKSIMDLGKFLFKEKINLT